MIDLKTTVLGEKEIAQTFTRAQSELRTELQQELDEIGKDIVLGARAAVPHRTGFTMSRIIYRHGQETRRGFQSAGNDRLILTVLPGEPTAHLIERGVNATVTRRRQRSGDVRGITKSGRKSRKLVALGVNVAAKPYRLVIRPRPYFIPAVESVQASLPGRLQAAVERVAAKLQGGA